MAEISLALGRTSHTISLPAGNILAELKPAPVKTGISPEQLIRRALSEAVAKDGTPAIRKEPTTILIPDKTRNCRADLILPILLQYLNDLGVCDAQIQLLIANGSHVSNDPDEVRQIVGRQIVERVKIHQHDSRNDAELEFVAETSRGVPVYLNQLVTGAAQLIVTGTVVHHYFAGFGGGLKLINPGCAGYETITKNHALTISKAHNGIHPGCKIGEIAGNPVQDDLRESIQSLLPLFLVETVLDSGGDVAGAFAGELFDTHRTACKFVDSMYKIEIAERADLVVASCGGYPKDINLIQAHKTLHNAYQAVKENGVLLILAECSQGIGSATLLDWFGFENEEAMVAELAERFTLNGTTALALRSKARQVRIILVSKLESSLAKKMKMVPAASVAEGWQMARAGLADDFTCYIIPNGSLTLPVSVD